MNIEVSIGEIIDKWTILSIKLNKITDVSKLDNILKEKLYLDTIIQDIISDPLIKELIDVNEQLWCVEDKLREHEEIQLFNNDFIQLARSVYKLNDKRSQIKKQINIKYKSNFIEEKSFNI
jgi:hypothetical protein